MKIKNMLLLSLLSFSVIPMVLFLAIVLIQTRTHAKAQYNDQVADMASIQLENLDQYFYSQQQSARVMAGHQGVVLAVEQSNAGNREYEGEAYEQANLLLQNLVQTDRYVEAAVLIDQDDTVLATTEDIAPGGTLEFAQTYKDAAGNAPSLALAMQKGSTDRAVRIPFCEAVYDANGDVIGYYIAVTGSAVLQRIVSELKVSSKETVCFADDLNLIFAYPFSEAISAIAFDESQNKILSNQLLETTAQSGGSFRSYMQNKIQRYAYIARSEKSGWAVISMINANGIYAAVEDAHSNILWFAIPLILLVAGIIVYLSMFMTRPIMAITETINKIKRGDLDARVDFSIHGEYGHIARAFNKLADDIVVSEGRYRTIVEMSDNIIFEWNFQKNEVFVSNNFNKKFSYRAPTDRFEDSFLNKIKVFHDDERRYRADLEGMRQGGVFLQNEYRFRTTYGDYIWVLMRAASLNDRDGKPLKAVGVLVDIDRAKKSELLLLQRASYDVLTELYNRATFERTLGNEMELSGKRRASNAIMFVDIDDFKLFNDQYGHACGDEVLKFTARTILAVIGENGFAGRYGGDEFVICLRNIKENSPDEIAQRILDTLSAGFYSEIVNDTITVACSIGVALIKDSGQTCEEIIGSADDAMYKIKKSGKSNYGYI